ncbi:MAG: HEPN domain-containing protein [Dehalococcoidia bacterium]
MTEPLSADAQTWLNSALRDRAWAKYDLDGGYYAQACFACQQAFEKLLKAVLLAHGIPFPKIHELVRLVQLCSEVEPTVVRFEEDARNIDSYYISTRYPDLAEEHEYTREEALDALQTVDDVLATLRPAIEQRLDKGTG